MMVPTIHRNGTTRQELLRQQVAAMNAIDTALEAMGKASPHGRDFYPQSPSAFLTAAAEHQARVEALQGVRDQLMQLAEAIAGIDA